jgi:hypothetical protein
MHEPAVPVLTRAKGAKLNFRCQEECAAGKARETIGYKTGGGRAS